MGAQDKTDLQTATLSDGLEALIRAFERTRDTGMIMRRVEVATFIDGLKSMRDQARHLETIADRAQWNLKARREQLEAGLANGKVTVFPVAPRATAFTGDDGGAA